MQIFCIFFYNFVKIMPFILLIIREKLLSRRRDKDAQRGAAILVAEDQERVRSGEVVNPIVTIRRRSGSSFHRRRVGRAQRARLERV